MLARTVPVMLMAVTVAIYISTINTKDKTEDVNVLPVIVPFIALVIGFGIYRGIRRLKGLFESYTLTLTGNLVMREQLNTPTISIYFNDVKDIVKNRNGSFTILGKDPTDIILVPLQIENYHELENALAQIRPFSTKPAGSFLQKNQAAVFNC